MGYLITQIATCLLAAVAAGVALGWLLRSRAVADRLAGQDRAWTARVDSLRQQLDSAESRRAVASVELESVRVELASAVTRLTSVQLVLAEREARVAELEPLVLQVEQQDFRMHDLLERQSARERELEAEIVRLTNFVEQLEPLMTDVEQRDARLRTLELQHCKTIEQKDAEIARLLGRSPETTPARDDLTRIAGIEPRLESLLNELGVTRFRQIAAWTEREIETFSEKLGGVGDRIRRNDWPRSARREHRRKYGES